MARRISLTSFCLGLVLLPAHGTTQISFPKADYYLAMGDSVAAGQGALPMTHGYAYQLYDRGVFGNKPQMFFVNVAIKGARSWDLRDHQVPQVLCSTSAARPTIVTVTAGANDFFTGDTDISPSRSASRKPSTFCCTMAAASSAHRRWIPSWAPRVRRSRMSPFSCRTTTGSLIRCQRLPRNWMQPCKASIRRSGSGSAS
jgi:lysophospholipase L1-like esterase